MVVMYTLYSGCVNYISINCYCILYLFYILFVSDFNIIRNNFIYFTN